MMKDTGSGGDSYTYRHSEMYKKIREGEWLSCPRADHIEGVLVKPFVVADVAFPMEPIYYLKCYSKCAFCTTVQLQL